jgi:penicillin-binding protein 2
MADSSRSNPLRTLLFYSALLVAVLVLVGRLIELQVVDNATYVEQAFENRVTRINEPAPRGVIYDRHGVALSLNVPTFAVTLTPAYLPDNPAELEQIFGRLSKLLDMPLTVPGSTPQRPCTPGRGIRDLYDEFKNFTPYSPFKIKCDIDKDIALVIREEAVNMPGVDVIVEPARYYPTSALTAQLVGYMAPIPNPNESEYFNRLYTYYTGRGLLPNRDRIGVFGVEASMQDELAGQNGSQLVEEDAAGQVLRVIAVETETVPGQNLQLTIDVRLQAAAEAALTGRLNFINTYFAQARTTSGVAIVMNPMTGEILAMVSWPTFDNNRFARTIDYDYYQALSEDPDYPLINHAVSVLYPPGSVFKLVTATGAMEEHVIDANKQLNDPGQIIVRNRYFPLDPGKQQIFVCWKKDGHGKIAFVEAIAQSCDVYFYKIGGGWEDEGVEGLGIDRLAHWMELFGFGRFTNVELPAEDPGFIPSSVWKRRRYGENWSTGDTYNAAFGQGYVLSTPLQMLNAINAIINGGYLYQPTIIDKYLDGEGNVITDTQPILLRDRLPISDETIRLIHEGMREAVLSGTLSGDIGVFAGEENTPIVDVPGVNVAGKTGTAEYCDKLAASKNLCVPGQWPTHAWTSLYAPFENPEVSVIVLVYNGGEGSKVAAPVANAILRAYFQLKEADATEGGGAP